jgi:DNA invertase Pin-like site-specific DNA recombinase
MATKTKAYSYLRFSTPEQARGDSFRRQSTLALEYLAAHPELELDETLRFEALGVSAFRGSNVAAGSALDKFRKLVEAGTIARGSYLLVEALDRISRDQIVEAQSVFLQLILTGVVIVTLMDGKVYSHASVNQNPMDMVFSLVLLMRGHDESKTKSNRLKGAWVGKRAKAKAEKQAMTRICPAWLVAREDRKGYRTVKERAAIVQRIYTMAAEGVGQQSIARVLNAEGVPTWGLGTRKAAAQWHRSYVAKILSNPAVIGIHVPHEESYSGGKLVRVALDPIPDYFPPVVDDDMFQRVQAMRTNADPLRGRHAGQPVQNVFGGLLRCPHCASSMQMVYKGAGAKGGQRKVVCSKARGGAGCKGRYTSISYPMLEQTLVEQLPLLWQGVRGSTYMHNAIGQTERKIAQTETALARIMDELQTATQPTLRLRLERRSVELATELDALRATLKEQAAQAAAADAQGLSRKVKELRAALRDMDRAKANVALRQLAKAIIVDHPASRLVVEWQHGGRAIAPFVTA